MRDKNLNQIVSDVRKAYKKGKLGEDQIRRLDDIGFDFIGQKARGVTLRESVADLLRTYPHEYTYSEIANIFDVDWNVCYRIIRYQGLEELVKPVRGRVNIAGLLDDYENIRDVKHSYWAIWVILMRSPLQPSNRPWASASSSHS